MVTFETGLPHSSYYALQRTYRLGTFGRAIVSIQVMFSNPERAPRANNQVSTFTLQDAADLTRLAKQIARKTHLLPAQQPENRSKWAFKEQTGFIVGSNLPEGDTMAEVKALVANALGWPDIDFAVHKLHLLFTGSIRGQVSSLEMRTDTKYNVQAYAIGKHTDSDSAKGASHTALIAAVADEEDIEHICGLLTQEMAEVAIVRSTGLPRFWKVADDDSG